MVLAPACLDEGIFRSGVVRVEAHSAFLKPSGSGLQDLIDTLHVVQVPILLGRGVLLSDGVEAVEDRYNIEAVSSPSGVTHVTLHIDNRLWDAPIPG